MKKKSLFLSQLLFIFIINNRQKKIYYFILNTYLKYIFYNNKII